MIYKLIVHAAFLAAGYYIGKEVAKKQFADEQLDRQAQAEMQSRRETEAQAIAGKGSPTIN